MPSHEEPGAVNVGADAEPAAPSAVVPGDTQLATSSTKAPTSARPAVPKSAPAPGTTPTPAPAADEAGSKEPREHEPPLGSPIQLEQVRESPRAESTHNQRQITVQWYETDLPFRFDDLDRGLRNAWLTAQTVLGVYRGNDSTSREALHVVLGLQGDRYITRIDYATHQPRFYRASKVIVETLSVRYYRHASGCLAFMTAGGRRQITQQRLSDFHAMFLGIASERVRAQEFDAATLRTLVNERFRSTLHRTRHANPSGDAFRSISEVAYGSKDVLDPESPHMKEILDDPIAGVASFESKISIRTDALKRPAVVRFAIRGSGTVRLQFPKLHYKRTPTAPAGQADAYYGVVRETIDSIVDADYFARRQISQTEQDVSTNWSLFAGSSGSTPFVRTFSSPDVRRVFFADLDLAAPERSWLPHLQAVNALMAEEPVAKEVRSLADELVAREPEQATRLVFRCRDNSGLDRVGEAVSAALEEHLPQLGDEHRAAADEALLAWFVARESAAWDVDPATSVVTARSTRWSLEDLPYGSIPIVLWKLVVVLHDRLMRTDGDAHADLRRLAWCFGTARRLHPLQPGVTPGLRLVLTGDVPTSVQGAARVLPSPGADLAAVDRAVLQEYGLPLWPTFRAARSGSHVHLTNEGLGAAHAVAVNLPSPTRDGVAPAVVSLPAGASLTLTLPADVVVSLDVAFEKYGRGRRATVPVEVVEGALAEASVVRAAAVVDRRRIANQRELRSKIDPTGQVIGSSPAILQLFEEIEYANTIEGEPAVLITGETGVGKTYVAELLHKASRRGSGPFRSVTAAAVGGDPNIQRGEWIGYGRDSAISGVPKEGRAGHVLATDGGTLFIDEFALLSAEMQGVFLSVLERQSIQKVGGESVQPNVRCVLATNADVDALASQGKLKPDLLARVPVRIAIPPLRARRGDVLLLVRSFAAAAKPFTERALLTLARHSWPSNIRELKSKVQAAVARATVQKVDQIDANVLDLPAELIAQVMALSDDDVRRELWTLADEAARQEGCEPNKGLQRRVAEIVGVSEATASRAYSALGLAAAAG